MYNVKTPETETETHVSQAVERFNARLEQLFSEEREGLDPRRDRSRLEHLAATQSYAEERKQEYVRQYSQNLARLDNLGRGKKEPVTIGAYMQKQDVYKRIFENSLGLLIEEVTRRMMNTAQNLKVA